MRPPVSSRSSARSFSDWRRWSSSPPASMSPACCSPARRDAGASWRSARRWAHPGCGWRASCSTETILIALVGLVGAWVLAWGTVRAIGNIPIGIDIPVRFELVFDVRIFVLAALAALARRPALRACTGYHGNPPWSFRRAPRRRPGSGRQRAHPAVPCRARRGPGGRVGDAGDRGAALHPEHQARRRTSNSGSSRRGSSR